MKNQKTRKATSAKVVVVVDGGVVTDILSTDRNVDVLVVDRDARDCGSAPAYVVWRGDVCGDEKEMQGYLEQLNTEFDNELNKLKEEDEDLYWEVEEFQSTLLTFMTCLEDGTTIA